MKNLKDLTVLIVTYKTKKKILIDCIKSINRNVKILIIENSKNFEHQDIIRKYSNIKFFCTGNNLGYGNGNNYGIRKIKTKYVLILNPDIICDKNLFLNISKILQKKINFHLIGCQYIRDKVFMPAGFFNFKKNKEFIENFKNKKVGSFFKVDWIRGSSMLINLKFFNNNIFNKNFFLFFEEFDLCKSVLKKGGNIFTCANLKIHHLGFKSSLGNSRKEKMIANNVKNWHWMWSRFYFYKKHYNFWVACNELKGKFIKSFLKMIFYSILFKTNERDKYLYRFLGIFNSLLNKPSWFRGKL